MMPYCDPNDKFVYPYYALIIDFFFARLNAAKLKFHKIHLEKLCNCVSNFEIERFRRRCDVCS